MEKIVAMTVWGRRISPVFDAATTLLVVHLTSEGRGDEQYVQFARGDSEQVTAVMHAYGASHLVCGAISLEPAKRLESAGVVLVPFVTGRVDEIIHLLMGNQPIDGLRMPGCGRVWGRGCGPWQQVFHEQGKIDGGTDMPGRDGKGPQGKGPQTGAGRGQCCSDEAKRRQGQGQGRGHGGGKGNGRGLGKGRGQGLCKTGQMAGQAMAVEKDENKKEYSDKEQTANDNGHGRDE